MQLADGTLLALPAQPQSASLRRGATSRSRWVCVPNT